MLRIVRIKDNFDNKINLCYDRLQIILFSLVILILGVIIKICEFSITNSSPYMNSDIDKFSNLKSEILDRNDIVIATNIPTSSAYIYTKYFFDSENSLKLIAKNIQIDTEYIKKRLKKNSFIWLKRHLTPKEQQRLHDLGIPGIHFIDDQKRLYPHDNLFSHVIGFVDIDNNGISGLEYNFDNYLKKGNILNTSLDIRIQYIVREELMNSIKMHGAIGGSAIVMNVKTGEIISSVSIPDFNPNNSNSFSKDSMFNQAMNGVYEMGSIFKTLTLAIAIDTKAVSINDFFDVSKQIKINKHIINDYRGGKGRILSLPEILMYSSNIGTAHIVKAIGINKQKEYFKKLGLFFNTNLEIPEKGTPIIPKEWREINSITIGYGHGISTTPAHFIQAFSSVVNNGLFKKATLLKGHDSGTKRIFKTETSNLMNKILRVVATSGSAKNANNNDYLVGAKTGTAEKIKYKKYDKNSNIASCIAAFPMNEPQYSILVLIDEPKINSINHGFRTGGMVAAPVLSKIISRIAPILGITPVEHQDPNIKKALHIDYQQKTKDNKN